MALSSTTGNFCNDEKDALRKRTEYINKNDGIKIKVQKQ